MSGENVLLTKVVPAFGAIISTAMYFSPLKAVLRAHKERNLGDLNPFPFGVTIANTIVWLAYGLTKKDPFVTAPNAPGVLVSTFNTLTAFALADEQKRSKLKLVCCLTAAILPVLGVCSAFAATTSEEKLAIWGLAGNLIALVYYGAPLTSMYEVIKTRNSASILVPLTLMNTANAALWTVYGFAVPPVSGKGIGDPYIWVPNGLGLILSLLQVALRVVFPAKAAQALPGHQHHAGGSSSKYSRLDEEHPTAELH